MAILPMAVYGLEVPAGDVPIAAKADIPAAFRITMAAIDPSQAAEGDELPRATLKLIRAPLLDMDDDEDDDESDFDIDEMDAMLAEDASDDEEDELDDELVNGGPSDPTKGKKARKAALMKALAEEMDVDAPTNGVKGKGKGKMLDISEEFEDDDEDDEDEDDDDDDEFEPEEFVICTLDPTKQYQQTLDITIGEDERVWFKVSGTHTIYLTGNYVEPDHQHPDMYDDEDDYDSEEEDYDLSPDEDELEMDEDDELDDLENPRVTEVEEEDEAPALIAAAPKKADKKNKKRAAEESADEASTLDDLITKAADSEPKLSKKQQKKLKNNAGQAVPADEVAKKEETPKSDKKSVQFAKNLELGPTGSPAIGGAAAATTTRAADKSKGALGVKTVQGITIDDKKLGTGPAAKKGDRIGMRYIGKLKDGKVFDSNKKGKPFSFKLGTGEVIKGWDIGIAGMTVGGERRITVPASLAYGSKSLPGIPANSTLIFDVKCIEIK